MSDRAIKLVFAEIRDRGIRLLAIAEVYGRPNQFAIVCEQKKGDGRLEPVCWWATVQEDGDVDISLGHYGRYAERSFIERLGDCLPPSSREMLT